MGGSSVRGLVHRDAYRDSVELMRIAAEVEQLSGVTAAAALMATPANRELLERAGLLVDEATEAGPNDLVLAVQADDDESARAAIERATELLAGSAFERSGGSGAAERPAPPTIADALADGPSARLAIISTPGPYAAAEALKALKRGLHVFLFSDNVPVDEEIELKRLARQKGLLVMGPDCGTAILDGVPIGFANAVRRGRIGLVGASGTGLQQVSCLLDRLGEGVSQVIGVGSHDLSEEVGGLMMLAGIDLLAADADTAVVVLISKPPAPVVARRVLERARACSRPVVVNFLGGDPEVVRAAGAVPAATLEAAARLAVSCARGESAEAESEIDAAGLAALAAEHGAGLAPGQRAIRGLYSGGTLCQEAAQIISATFPDLEQAGHLAIDLGADEYTVGRPHPMIDFRLRNEQIVEAARDPQVAVILLDVVLGYGSHLDPAGALVPAIERAREEAQSAGRQLVFVGSVCGTAADPQNLAEQERRLGEAGVVLLPSNAQAAWLAARIALNAEQRAASAPAEAKKG